MKLNDILDEPIKIMCSQSESRAIQLVLKKLGCRWRSGDELPSHLDMLGLLINPYIEDGDCLTGWSDTISGRDSYKKNTLKELTPVEFFEKFKDVEKEYTENNLKDFTKFYIENINSYTLDEAFNKFFKLK